MNPINPAPRPAEILALLNEAGLNRNVPRTRCSWPVPVATAAQWWKVTSPVCSHVGLACIRYKGPQGAVVQLGMTVIASNGAALVRIRQQRLSKRAQKFRRLLGLRCRNVNQVNDPKI